VQATPRTAAYGWALAWGASAGPRTALWCCRSGNGLICLRWYDFQGVNAKKPEWKKFIKSYVTKIERTGFSYEDQNALFSSAPIIVNAEELAKSIVDDTLDRALKPFQKALDSLVAAKPAFDEMIRAALKQFGSSGD
jgi:hypothetical protein